MIIVVLQFQIEVLQNFPRNSAQKRHRNRSTTKIVVLQFDNRSTTINIVVLQLSFQKIEVLQFKIEVLHILVI